MWPWSRGQQNAFITWVCLFKRGITNYQWHHSSVPFYFHWNCLASSEFGQRLALQTRGGVREFWSAAQQPHEAAYRGVLPKESHLPWTGLRNFQSFSAPQLWWLCSPQPGLSSGQRILCPMISACAAGWVQIWWPSSERSFCSQWPVRVDDTRIGGIFAFQTAGCVGNKRDLFPFLFFFSPCKDLYHLWQNPRGAPSLPFCFISWIDSHSLVVISIAD